MHSLCTVRGKTFADLVTPPPADHSAYAAHTDTSPLKGKMEALRHRLR